MIDRRLNYAKFSEGRLRNVVSLNDPLDIIVSQTDQFPLNDERLDIGCESGEESASFFRSHTTPRNGLSIFCDRVL